MTCLERFVSYQSTGMVNAIKEQSDRLQYHYDENEAQHGAQWANC